MMMKSITTIVALSVLVSLPATAQPKKMTSAKLDQIVAGGGETCPPPPPETLKGNNGWGNGADGNNPGSGHGATAPSKLANGSVSGYGSININPTTSTGR